jgi:ABC-type uncharacterized transport system auxiliary subunit
MILRSISCLIGVAGAVLLASCGTVPKTPTRTFILDPGAPAKTATLPGAASVAFVDVGAPFASGQFQYRLGQSQWEADPYNRFLLSPSEMFTGILRTWLRDSRQFQSVALPGGGGGQAYLFAAEVVDLYVDFQNPEAPRAVLTLMIKVTHRMGEGKTDVILRRQFSASEPVVARTPDAFVTAWNGALRSVLQNVTAALQK